MAEFDPDAYLAQKTAPASGFDPDAYLAQKGIQEEEPGIGDKIAGMLGGTKRGFIKGALDTLPMIGMGGGGIVGTMAGPLGTLGGAGLGAGAGKALQNIGEKYLLDEDKTRSQIYGDPAEAALSGLTAEMGGQVTGKLLDMAAGSKPVQKGVGMLKKAGAKAAETFTGVPAQETMTYAENQPIIKQMGKEFDNSVPEAADAARKEANQKIQSFRKVQNDAISSAIENSPGSKKFDIKDILESLEKEKIKYNPIASPDKIEAIDGLIQKVKLHSPEQDGFVSLKDLGRIRSMLDEEGKSAFQQMGQVFPPGQKATAIAAKNAYPVASDMLKATSPEVAESFQNLSNLHKIEDVMNPNLIAEGKPEAALMAAGSGGNQRAALNLQNLDKLTGTRLEDAAKNLAAMRTFGNPKYMALGNNGKTATHLLTGAGAGMAIGGALGGKEGAIAGGSIGSALTSPLALKAAIDSGLLTKEALQKVIQNPQLRSMLIKAAGDLNGQGQ